MKVHIFNENDMSNNKLDISGADCPSEFTTNDVSQNLTSNVTINSVTMSTQHKDKSNTLDIWLFNNMPLWKY